MSQPTVFFTFLWIVVQVTISVRGDCRDPCTCTFNDKDETNIVDLSAVGRRNGPARFFMLKEENNVSMLYAYNPCYPISYHTQEFEIDRNDQRACSDAAVCIITPGNSSGSSPTQRAIGYQRDAVFFHDGDTVKINYTAPENVGKKPLIVTLKCNPAVMHQLTIQNETSFTLTTKCACKDTVTTDECRAAAPSPSSKSGLSTGSILLITFFVILLVYVGFGILFNFCKGAHGTELFPNFEFWNELPKLIVDGFLFTCSCFGRRSSYADV